MGKSGRLREPSKRLYMQQGKDVNVVDDRQAIVLLLS